MTEEQADKESHIPVGAIVKITSVPYEARKQQSMLVGYKFRVVDNEWGVYTLSCPLDFTFYDEHLEIVKES
jgi:hypothetical protein